MSSNNTVEELNAIASKILIKSSLYRKHSIPFEMQDIWGWTSFKIKAFCNNDQTYQTFTLKLPNELENFYRRVPGDSLNVPKYNKGLDNSFDFSFHIHAFCSYCGKFRMDFLVNIFQINKQLFAKKIGMFPPYEISPGKDVLKYLNNTHQDYYKKALMNISHGYGIGAFAYFRRITEELIKQIIQDLITAGAGNTEGLNNAWTQYQQKHSMSVLLDEVSPFLPVGLKEVGDNPLRLLYNTASMGIHQMTEDECQDKANNMDILFRYVIEKMTEETGKLKDIRQAIKNLKS